MNKQIQNGLIGLYRAVKATGLLDNPVGRRVFEASYHLYKERLEAGPIQVLRPWVRPGTVVIDVGANVGFFTRQFAAWISEGGRVIALEPEAVNFARLQRAIGAAGLTDVVELIRAAAAETSGEGRLEVNPGHPGDHKLGTDGVAVAMTTLDDLLASRGWPEVSLIKIDVQGAEARVLAGAARTLERFRPALFLEVDDQQLRRYGSSARELFTSTTARGYTIHSRIGGTFSDPLSVDEALSLGAAKDYDDLLLLPKGTVPQPGAPQTLGAGAEPAGAFE